MTTQQKEKIVSFVTIMDTCTGCRLCSDAFACPAINFIEEQHKAKIDPNLCINCGQCISVCDTGHIIRKTISRKL